MDAITLLKTDHRTVEKLFKQFEKAGDRAYVEKRKIVDRFIEELSVHAAVEEQLFYPVARATVPDAENMVLEAAEEHHVMELLLAELERLAPEDEKFDAKVTVLIENVRHHIKGEETDFFPKVRKELSRSDLAELGEAMAKAKSAAPTHPHPRAPETGPAVHMVGAVAGMVDRVTDNVSGAAQGGVLAVQDLVARILGRKRPKASPTGTTLARSRATDVRKAASSAVEGVEETVGTAASGAASVASTAKSGAKGTATSAKRGTSTTRTTAKRAATTTGRTAKSAAKKTSTTAKRAASKTAASASGKQ